MNINVPSDPKVNELLELYYKPVLLTIKFFSKKNECLTIELVSDSCFVYKVLIKKQHIQSKFL